MKQSQILRLWNDSRQTVQSAWTWTTKGLNRANRLLSPPWLILPMPVVAFGVMIIASALVMALEVVNFHLLLYVTDYLKATSVISIALLGIAIGGFLAFAFGRFSRLWVLLGSSVLLGASLIFDYLNVLQIASWGQPLLLILPFVFSSLIISTLFMQGNPNALYFMNLAGSGLGVMLPVLLMPAFKSELSLFVLLWVPIALATLLSWRVPNVILKSALLAAIVFAGFELQGFLDKNLSYPERWSQEVFERKILPELEAVPPPAAIGDPAAAPGVVVNYTLAFFNRVYQKPAAGSEAPLFYRFQSDDYDLARAKTFLQVLGFVDRFGLPGVDLLGTRRFLTDWKSIPAAVYENEILPEIRRRYTYRFDENFDLAFIKKAYRLEGKEYHLSEEYYTRMRAKLLLGDLGHFPFIDLGIDLPRHGSFSSRLKFFNENQRIVLSEDSTLGRVEYTSNQKTVAMAMNGVYLDLMDSYNGSAKDPRVPHIGAGKVFIVGLSADGIVKSAKRLPKTEVHGVELNPTIWRTMTDGGVYAQIAAEPYKGVNAVYGEARSYLENHTDLWDMISLMNIHADHGAVSTLGPENFHTVEGTKLLLSRLTDRGILNFEEILVGQRSELAFLKFLNTAKTALRQTGVTQPERCIYIFRWDFFGGSTFRTLVIKKRPFTPAEEAQMDQFVELVKATGLYSGVEPVYNPIKVLGTSVETFLRSEDQWFREALPYRIPAPEFHSRVLSRISDPRDLDFLLARYRHDGGGAYVAAVNSFKPAETHRVKTLFRAVGFPYEIDLRPTTDDSPFPFNVYRQKSEVYDILAPILGVSLILLIPLLILLLRAKGEGAGFLWPGVIFVSLSGFGFMLVEIVLVQKFQLFLGDPTLTLMVVLGGMLVFSGVGSLTSQWFPRWLVVVATALIPALLLVYMVQLGSWFQALSGLDATGKIWGVLGLLFPLTFLMGIPFPSALGAIQKKTSGDFSALLFGVSGVFSTLGSAFAVLINVSEGFHRSFEIGTLCYGVGLVFFLMVFLGRIRKKA